ncbi:MAG: hypothetical protein K6A40_13060 [Solobacterium sp.]|nr:hypothetical protein [Solobacterium sp.]
MKMTAMYMLNDWWTRPAFITSFKEIPARTQLLMIRTEETCYCRADKYAGFTSAEEWQEYDDHDVISLHEAGPFCWYSDQNVKCVKISGNDVSAAVKEENGMYVLDPETAGSQAVIEIFWE